MFGIFVEDEDAPAIGAGEYFIMAHKSVDGLERYPHITTPASVVTAGAVEFRDFGEDFAVVSFGEPLKQGSFFRRDLRGGFFTLLEEFVHLHLNFLVLGLGDLSDSISFWAA